MHVDVDVTVGPSAEVLLKYEANEGETKPGKAKRESEGTREREGKKEREGGRKGERERASLIRT